MTWEGDNFIADAAYTISVGQPALANQLVTSHPRLRADWIAASGIPLLSPTVILYNVYLSYRRTKRISLVILRLLQLMPGPRCRVIAVFHGHMLPKPIQTVLTFQNYPRTPIYP